MAILVSQEEVKVYQEKLAQIRSEISKLVIGQSKTVDSLLRGLLCDGHVLLEGVPGVAKTTLVKTFATITGCSQSRIQFTADLLPADITGITAYNEKTQEFYTVKGPVFANFLMADEINRATPKVQSALLEAMQERQVTIGRETFKLALPFFVMATSNPLESEGVYTLPEAQIDRFLFKILVDYPSLEDERQVLKKNITIHKFEDFGIKPVLNPEEIIKLQNFVKNIYCSEKVEDYILHLVDATRHPHKYKLNLGRFIEAGCSPRATIALYIASKAEALLNGDNYVTPQHVKNIAHDSLRHRLILNYEGEAENISKDDIVTELLAKIPIP
ncbi:MAG: MoxR family ATPase [Nanoarchaeota archaeon]